MLNPSGRIRNTLAFTATVLLGMVLSLGLYNVWNLQTRWIVVIFVGIAGVSASMCFARVFSDFLLIVTFFSFPFATFTKWLLVSGAGEENQGGAVVGTFGIGMIDFLLIGLYMSWFYRIFITRTQEVPRLNLLDGLVLFYIFAYFLAAIGSEKPAQAFGATEYVLKHAMFYFYVSRNLKERHLPWLLAAFVFAIAIEVPLATYQYYTGKLVGLALDKGAGGSQLNTSYEVPGVETARATGTSTDSHMLGDFIGAMLPFALVLLFTPRLRPLLKLVCLAAAGGALLVVMLSLSRTAWIATAVVLAVGVILILVVWRERQVVPALAGLVLFTALITPLIAGTIYERFANSPYGTISTRFDQFKVAWYIFTLHPVFGVGPNNYTEALKSYDYIGMVDKSETGDITPERLPVHNGFLLHAAELGIIGFAAYLAILVHVTWRLFSVVQARRDIVGRLALAAFLGILTIELNDQFIVGLRNPDVFILFWLLVALAAVLPRLPLGAGAALLAPASPASVPIRAGIAVSGPATNR
jgi:putative inorganic carbon (hco3(-)) transporter